MPDINSTLVDARERFAAAAAAAPPRFSLQAEGRSATLHMYGVIGGWWGDIDAATVVPQIRELDVDEITVYINSPGGDAFDGIAIRNALRGHRAQITAIVDGLAASAASIIAVGADQVLMGEGTELMIHDAWMLAIGNADDMRAAADELDRLSDDIAGMYARKAGGTAAQWRQLMKDEVWYTADEAVAAGLADRIDSDEAAEGAAAAFDLSMYAHAGRAAASAPIPVAALAAHREGDPEMPRAAAEVVERDTALEDLRVDVADMQRSLAALADRGGVDQPAAVDTRTAGEWLRDLASNDADTVRDYEAMVAAAYSADKPRAAYDGGTSADGILNPQWVGDTIKLIEAHNPLGGFFSKGALPSKGLQLEYGVLVSDTTDVAVQANEGDDLTKGKIVVDVEHATIYTYGGYVELTRQQIERTTNVNLLNLHLRGLAMKARKRKATTLRALYSAQHATNADDIDLAVVVDDLDDYKKWLAAIVTAAGKFDDMGLALDGLVLDTTTFLGIGEMAGTDGRSLLKIDGGGEAVNTVGEIKPRTITGSLMGVPFVVDAKLAAGTSAFASTEAIRQYNGSVAELADENIVNLSKRFGLYYYAANAAEIPTGLLPVVAAAPSA